MKYINCKKIIPGLISVIIIAGMAVQSFATNVDMAAFVNKDKYMSKYYELDWRIDEIDKSIERLYKFVCTNLRSYAGAGREVAIASPFVVDYLSQNDYHWFVNPIADLSEQGYLRVNGVDVENSFGNHSKVDVFEKEIPAAICKWRSDVELYPHTKIIMKITRTWPNTTAIRPKATYQYQIYMGPFKKFPHYANTGWANSFCSIPNLVGITIRTGSTKTYYAYGTDSIPTNYTQMSTGYMGMSNTVSKDNGSLNRPELRANRPTTQEMADYFYSDPAKAEQRSTVFYWSEAPINVSSYDKLWFYQTLTQSNDNIDYWINTQTMNLTTWNNNK